MKKIGLLVVLSVSTLALAQSANTISAASAQSFGLEDDITVDGSGVCGGSLKKIDGNLTE